MDRPPRDVDFSRFPLQDVTRLLRGAGIQLWRQVLQESPPEDRSGGEAGKENSSPPVLRPRMTQPQNRLLLRAAGEEFKAGEEPPSPAWWRRLLGPLRKVLRRRQEPSPNQSGESRPGESARERPQNPQGPSVPDQGSSRAADEKANTFGETSDTRSGPVVPYLATLRRALKSGMSEDAWRQRILGKLWQELDGRPGGALPDAFWELAGEAAFTDPRFQGLAARSALNHLKENVLLVDSLPPLRFHPNAFWLLLAVAGMETPRLQRLARRKALEEDWVGPWEGWLIRRLQRRFPESLAKLSVPLRQRLDAAAQTVQLPLEGRADIADSSP